MKAAIVRWAFYLAALLLVGPLAASLLGGLRAPGGGPDATPLVSSSPAMGVALALAALAIALALGALAARLVGTMAGMSTAGLVVAWASWRTGTVDELVRTAQSGRPLISLAIEGLIFGVCGLGIILIIASMGRAHAEAIARRTQDNPQQAPPPAGFGAQLTTSLHEVFKGKGIAIALPIAIVAGGAAAMFIAGSPLKGQAIAAAIVGGIAVGAASRLVDVGATFTTMVIAVAALAVLGPLSGVATAGTGAGLVRATYAGTLFPLAWITPLDWIAGGLLGIPMGVSWAGSMMEKKTA